MTLPNGALVGYLSEARPNLRGMTTISNQEQDQQRQRQAAQLFGRVSHKIRNAQDLGAHMHMTIGHLLPDLDDVKAISWVPAQPSDDLTANGEIVVLDSVTAYQIRYRNVDPDASGRSSMPASIGSVTVHSYPLRDVTSVSWDLADLRYTTAGVDGDGVALTGPTWTVALRAPNTGDGGQYSFWRMINALVSDARRVA